MEAKKIKKREKVHLRLDDAGGEVPEAPKLEDFQFLEETSEKQHEDRRDVMSFDLDIEDSQDSQLKTKVATDEVIIAGEIGIEVVSGASSMLSLDPCEEAAEVLDFRQPMTEEGVPTTSKLYPLIPPEEETWENVSNFTSSIISQVEMGKNSVIPTKIMKQSELNSKIQYLYTNTLLESCDEKVEEFLKGSKSTYDGFELYELLCSYQRACNQLQGCEYSLNDLKERSSSLEKTLWSVDYETLNQTSTCMDGNTVTASHKYLVAKLNKEVHLQLDKVLRSTKELVKDSFSLYTYSVQLCKIQIRHFFYKSFKDINLQSFGVQGYYSGYPNGELQNCANLLKVCISTLFVFIRRNSTHSQVLKDCQSWLTDCVGLALRIATLDDHLFILNHVIRCPPGLVGRSLSCCVQIPPIPIPSTSEDYISSSFSNLNLDYALTVLKIILNPVPGREGFLKQVSEVKAVASYHNNDQWVVVDSDGEDDPEDFAFFKEGDLISLLHQIPFGDLFRRVLLIYKDQGEDVYDVNTASERTILKLLAFGTQLDDILGQGFVSYYTDRYRQLIKMLGRLILHTVQYITDHLEVVINHQKDSYQNGSLVLAEYDLFFRHAVGILFSGKNIGSLQFLAALPYHLISSEMLWHVYCAITKWLPIDSNYEAEISSEFENELISISESDSFYLLTTLANMANSRGSADQSFVRIVTLHLFQIGFLSPLTRDCCSKTARDLLGNLTRKYPEIISVLLHTINTKMQVLETFSLYLLKELAFDLWVPTDLDIKLIFNWLVTFPVSSIENQTARFVVQSMNLGFGSSGELFLSFEFHYQVALMIMESVLKWEKSQGFISDGMKQISSLGGSKIQDSWAWDLLKRLHLHAFDRKSCGGVELYKILNKLPTFESNPELECVRKGVEIKNPIASFLCLYLTPVGHSVPLICSKGIDLIEIILQNCKFEFVIHSLFFSIPLFVDCPEILHSNDKFRNILSTLLATDLTYVRMAKNLITSDFPGEVTTLVGEMISAQIIQCSRFACDERRIIGLWTECLTKLDSWNKDNNVLYLLEILSKACIFREDCHTYFLQYFSNIYKNMPTSSQSGISFLFSWSAPVTTLLQTPSYNLFPFFIYFLLCIEMELENQSGFWKTLCIKLNNPKTSLDVAVKKSSSASKFATSSSFLTVYRFAQLGLDLPKNHELTFLVWQKFFLRYFHRVSEDGNFQCSCVASRFFEGALNQSFYNKIRRKLNDLLAYCKEGLSVFERELYTSDSASVNPIFSKELLTDKTSLANACVMWIEDVQLLQPTLYLPALAPHFMPTMLLSLMDGEELLWRNYVDEDAIFSEERVCGRTFMVAICRSCWFDGTKLPRFSDLRISSSNLIEDLLKRLNSYDQPKEPPAIPLFEEIIPSSPHIMLFDCNALKSGLAPYWKHLKEFSEFFVLKDLEMLSLNCNFWEKLSELYTNRPAEIMVNARCSGKSGSRNWESCSGAAHILLKYTEAKLNEKVGHEIHQNRSQYQMLLDERGTKPPPNNVCIAAVVIEDFITNLVIHFRRSASDGNERINVSTVGSELFYYAASLVNENTDFYPPTRQLLSSLLEVLGTEFISSLPNQCHRLVTTSIKNPKLVGSLAPHLNLAACDISMLIDIYREISSIPRSNVDLAFVILTKFEINSWLRSKKPRFSERSQLIHIIWKCLISDGFTPKDEWLMVHDTYRNHLRNMLTFDFPEHYGEILALLLDGTEKGEISQQVWFDFCNGLSKDTIKFFVKMDPFLRKREARRFATEGSILLYQELVETAHLLAQHFTSERLAGGPYGLYAKYRQYIEAISCFLQMVAYSVAACSLTKSNGILSQNIIDEVWPILRDIYSPWMLPYNQKFIQQNCAQWIHQMNFDANSVLQPWIANDSQFAMIIVNDFTDCLMFLVETLPGNTTIFSYLWNFYVENFALLGVKEHVVGVVHNCFVSIPWAMYWPTFADVEGMCRIVEKFLPASHSFLSIVFAQISWLQWINSLSTKFSGKGHTMLLNLTVRLANDSVARESPTWVHVMEMAESKMHWFSISPSGLEPILNWLVMSIDPRVVLNLDTVHRMDQALLRLLETACGYGHPEKLASNVSSNSLELNTKRYCFVRSYVRLIVSASSKHKSLLDTQPKAFEDAIKNMVTELAFSVKYENQSPDFFMSHLKELLSLMTNHTLGTIARNAILEWRKVIDSHSLVFLLTTIQLSCSLNVKPYIVCPLIEILIGLCFQYSDANWESIRDLTVVNPEELNNFFDVCSKDGLYLFLYSLLLRRFNSLVEGGLDTICFFMDLLKNIKPRESNEEAVSLIYNLILKIVVQLHLEAFSHGATNETLLKHGKKFLLIFAQHLSSIGDDKQGWGLLGAFIGKSSQLSLRGRLFAKAISLFIWAQLPCNSPVRIDPGAEGHFLQESDEKVIKSHPELQSSLEKLESLKQSRQHSNLIECIDFTLEFINNPLSALSSSEIFISKLNGYLFSARYLQLS